MSDIPHATHAGWIVVGAIGPAASGLVAAAAEVPAATWIAAIGAIGSVIVPLAKVIADAQIKALRARLEAAVIQVAAVSAERDRLLSVITGAQAMQAPLPLPVAPLEPEAPKEPADVVAGPADGK